MNESIRRVDRVVADLIDGKPAVLLGGIEDADSYLVVAGEKANTSALDFVIRHTSGFVCAAVTTETCDRLELPELARTFGSTGDHYTVAVDAIADVSTGISASDRARTLRLIADPSSTPSEFTRPGHVIPVRAGRGGVLTRRRIPEAVVDLMRASELQQVGAYAALVSVAHPTRMASQRESMSFADTHELNWVSIQDVASHRRTTETHVLQVFCTVRDSPFGVVEAVGYHSDATDTDYVTYRMANAPIANDSSIYVLVETDAASHLNVRDQQRDSNLSDVLASGGGLVVMACRTRSIRSEKLPGGRCPQTWDGRDADLVEILRSAKITKPHLVDPPSGLSEALWALDFADSRLSC
jgi:3,4-dihydroxy 2-butanone 4-phosphate synthase/GTP cyclohydrolase II